MPAFARVVRLADVIQNGLRETQILPGEVVEILSAGAPSQRLIRKADGIEGWVESASLLDSNTSIAATPVLDQSTTFIDLQNEYRRTPYLSGGLSPAGIDCSGLMQIYLLRVRRIAAPRNSRQQRGLAPERDPATVREGDLVFALEKSNGRHHVGLFTDGRVWHCDEHKGVVHQVLQAFNSDYSIDAVISID
jgi:cell wall-associated NlpC family hydrolase